MLRLFPLTGAPAPDPAVEGWLLTRPGAIGELCRAWFAVLRSRGDDVRELMHDGQATACVGGSAFAYVAAYTAHVNVGFYVGSALPDPTGILEGSGKFMRHVKLRPGAWVSDRAFDDEVAGLYAARRAAAPCGPSPTARTGGGG